MLQLGRFRLDLISDGFFEDDADTFVTGCGERHSLPRVRVRGKPRIRVGFNSLLIRGNGHTVVVDPGTGDKPRSDKVAEYHMEWPRRFLPSLIQMGVATDAVDTVILTHLHWDHAGAATSKMSGGRFIPTFSRAKYFVQETELASARAAADRGDDSYCANDYEPLAKARRLQTVTGKREIVPGITVRWTGGHSRGLQIVLIESEGQRAVFLSDLIPTPTQLSLDCALSYDENFPQLRAAKEAVLAEAADRGGVLLFVHAPHVRAGRLLPRVGGAPVFETIEV